MFIKNFINAIKKDVLKVSSMFIVMFLISSMGTCLTSCGSDDKKDEPNGEVASGLYGIWETSASGSEWVNNGDQPYESKWETTSLILFNSQGKLLSQECSEHSRPGGAWTSVFMNFNSWYEIKDDAIVYHSGNTGKSEDCHISYKISGNSLMLEYVSGEKASILLGKDKITYYNKTKADILEYPYGSWKATLSTGNVQRNFSLTFNMDNQLSFYEKEAGSEYYTALEQYRYQFTGNTIQIYKKSNLSSKPDCTLSFQTTSSRITLEYSSGEKPLFMTVFNEDKVSFNKE